MTWPRVEGLSVRCGARWILHQVSLTLPERGVVALMGPGGAGKSTLLRALAGELEGSALELTGGWALSEEVRRGLVMQRPAYLATTALGFLVTKLPQRSQLTQVEQRAWVASALEASGLGRLVERLDAEVLSLTAGERRLLAILREVFADPALLGVDEPTAGLSETDAAEVVEVLAREGERRCVLMVSHHQGYARRLASRVVLLAGGRVMEESEAPGFFTSPQTEAGASFLQTGGCAAPSANATAEELDPAYVSWASSVSEMMEGAEAPEVQEVRTADVVAAVPSARLGPEGFCWSEPGRLAGVAMPGLLRPVEEDAAALRRCGVTALVTLTEQPLSAEAQAALGMEVLHVPIIDMRAPSLEEARGLCASLERLLERGEVVAVHCKAGLGRTGLALAALRVYRGAGGREALQQVRRLKSTWVQSPEQEDFLEDFHRYMMENG